MFTNRLPGPIVTGSRPDNIMGAMGTSGIARLSPCMGYR
jgi:hypothetical protein